MSGAGGGLHLVGGLPPTKCPEIFEITGGTRLFLVSGGPGHRLTREREAGKCELSHGGLERTNQDMAFVPAYVTAELSTYFRTPSLFEGAALSTCPVVWHDRALGARPK